MSAYGFLLLNGVATRYSHDAVADRIRTLLPKRPNEPIS